MGSYAGFDGGQPVVVGAVGCPHPLLPFLAKIVDVHPASSKGLHRFEEGAGPADVALRFCRIGPLGQDEEFAL